MHSVRDLHPSLMTASFSGLNLVCCSPVFRCFDKLSTFTAALLAIYSSIFKKSSVFLGIYELFVKNLLQMNSREHFVVSLLLYKMPHNNNHNYLPPFIKHSTKSIQAQVLLLSNIHHLFSFLIQKGFAIIAALHTKPMFYKRRTIFGFLGFRVSDRGNQ